MGKGAGHVVSNVNNGCTAENKAEGAGERILSKMKTRSKIPAYR